MKKIVLINERNKELTPIEQVLFNREIPKEQMHNFLNGTDDDILDYNLLDNINKAVQMFLYHYKKESKILIQVDADADGYTSAALLWNFLKLNFPEVDLDYQVHKQKAHGLKVTDDILAKKYSLIFVPDAGSNEYDIHKQVSDVGVDIIVLDHHDCEKYSDDALVVNNQLSKNYLNKNLSGVGVVYQFCRALNAANPSENQILADEMLDLVAVGLSADMMDVRDSETKRLIQKGCDIINNKIPGRKNPFISAIVEKQSYSIGGEVTSTGISWYIAPLINSITRVGKIEERDILFRAFLEENKNVSVPSTKRGHKAGDTEPVIEQTIRLLTNCKNRQKKAVDDAFAFLTAQYNGTDSIVVIDTKGELDKNLNGLVGNKLVAKFQRPALVLSKKDGSYFGSARNIEDDALPDFRNFILDSGFSEFAQGHAGAFGVSFEEDKLEEFIKYTNEVLSFDELSIKVDFIIEASELNPNFVLEIGSLKPFYGKMFDEPKIFIKNLKITDENIVLYSPDKRPTLKMSANEVDFIKFGSSKEEYESFLIKNKVSLVNVLGTCSINEWMGNISAQIKIIDYEIVGSIYNF